MSAELNQSRDRVQTVGEIVGLSAQRLAHAPRIVQFAQEALELGPVAEGCDIADGPAAHHDRHPADDQHAVGREDHLVGAGDFAAEHVADPTRRQHIDQPLAFELFGEPQQAASFIVHQRDPPVEIGRDRAFADPVQAGLALLEQRRDLFWLQAKRLAFQVAGQQQRADHAEAHGHQQVDGDLGDVGGEVGQELTRQAGLEEANRHDADDSTGAVEDGRLAACRRAERPPLDTFEGLALKDCGRVFVDRLADQGGIWVRIAGSVGAGDHDETRPGGLAHPLGQRLQNPRGIGIA